MFGAYFLRDYGFSEDASTAEDLILGFRQYFKFTPGKFDEDFDGLFEVGGEPDITWFEAQRI